jgi:hypothetical protein
MHLDRLDRLLNGRRVCAHRLDKEDLDPTRLQPVVDERPACTRAVGAVEDADHPALREKAAHVVHGVECNLQPDVNGFFVVRVEETGGLAQRHTRTPVLAQVEHWNGDTC